MATKKKVKFAFTKAPAALGLAYHKGQVEQISPELAEELQQGGYGHPYKEPKTEQEDPGAPEGGAEE